MQSEVYLQFAGALLLFLVRTTAAWLLCLLLARLFSNPGRRFSLLLVFSLGSLAHWVYLGSSLFFSPRVSSFPAAEGGRWPSVHVQQLVVPGGSEKLIATGENQLALIYGLGTFVLLAVALGRRLRLRSLLRQAEEPSPNLKELFTEKCAGFGLAPCDLLVLPHISSPATVYWWRPRILLPRTCAQLGAGPQMDDIFSHELAHVARRDYLWSRLSDFACYILFFHPGMWHARKQMRIEREMACDLAVVAARPEHRVEYASTLASVARLCLPRKHPVLGMDFAGKASLLSSRIHALLNEPLPPSWFEKLYRFIAGIALIAVYAVLFLSFALTIRFAQAPPLPQASSQTITPRMKSSVRPRTARVRGAQPRQSFVAESPAYRIKAVPYSPRYTAYASSSSPSDPAEQAEAVRLPVWRVPDSTASSVGTTLKSIIVATVGTIAGADDDKDERDAKRKDGHFQPSTRPAPY